MVCLALLSLAGCSPIDQVWARLEAGSVTFLVCEPTTANEIVVEQRPVDLSASYSVAWEAHAGGSQSFASGDVIEYGLAPEGFDNVVTAGSLNPTEYNYLLAILDRTEDGEVIESLNGLFRSGDLSSEHWVNQEGARSTDPCPV